MPKVSKAIALSKDVVAQYSASQTRIVTAESCTGGLLSATITEVPSSSKILDRGYVTYSNDAKIEDLHVPRKMIEQCGAVSAEVARAMVNGALAKADAHVAISITGIAGPTGGSENKPVGRVYIGFKRKNDDAQSFEYTFSGNRHDVREQTIEEALLILLKFH